MFRNILVIIFNYLTQSLQASLNLRDMLNHIIAHDFLFHIHQFYLNKRFSKNVLLFFILLVGFFLCFFVWLVGLGFFVFCFFSKDKLLDFFLTDLTVFLQNFSLRKINSNMLETVVLSHVGNPPSCLLYSSVAVFSVPLLIGQKFKAFSYLLLNSQVGVELGVFTVEFKYQHCTGFYSIQLNTIHILLKILKDVIEKPVFSLFFFVCFASLWVLCVYMFECARLKLLYLFTDFLTSVRVGLPQLTRILTISVKQLPYAMLSHPFI